jgi:putative transposase
MKAYNSRGDSNGMNGSKRRGRKIKFPEKYMIPLKEFILRDDNKGLDVMELKIKFEREINDAHLTTQNIGYWSYYNMIRNRRYLNLSYKKIKNYCINKFKDNQVSVDRQAYARALIYYISAGYKINYIDETSSNLNIRPLYGYSEKGKALRMDWLTPKPKNFTFIGVIDNCELLNFCIFEGGMRGNDFYYFLLKTIDKFNLMNQKVILVMDNLFCPKLKDVYPWVKDSINLLFLPKYAPMLNPIEYLFAYLKQRLRKHRYEDLDIMMLELNGILFGFDGDLLKRFETHTFRLLKDVLCDRLNEF